MSHFVVKRGFAEKPKETNVGLDILEIGFCIVEVVQSEMNEGNIATLMGGKANFEIRRK